MDGNDNTVFFKLVLRDVNGIVDGITHVDIHNEPQALAIVSACSNCIKQVIDTMLENKFGSKPRVYGGNETEQFKKDLYRSHLNLSNEDNDNDEYDNEESII